VTYRGLQPRTRLLRWSLFGLAIAIVVAGVGSQAADAVGSWFRDEYERLPWYLTRTTALLSYLALTGSVVYGLLLSTGILDRIAHRAVSFTLHQDLASIGLALALIHAAVLLIDRSVPFQPAELVVPFIGPYRPLWVAFGQLALILSCLVLFSFYVRRRIGQRTWRQLHYLSFLAFVAATAHGIMAGTDSGAGWVASGYTLAASVVTFLLAYRVVISLAARRGVSPAPSRAERRPAVHS